VYRSSNCAVHPRRKAGAVGYSIAFSIVTAVISVIFAAFLMAEREQIPCKVFVASKNKAQKAKAMRGVIDFNEQNSRI